MVYDNTTLICYCKKKSIPLMDRNGTVIRRLQSTCW